jgi:hypothetical protein
MVVRMSSSNITGTGTMPGARAGTDKPPAPLSAPPSASSSLLCTAISAMNSLRNSFLFASAFVFPAAFVVSFMTRGSFSGPWTSNTNLESLFWIVLTLRYWSGEVPDGGDMSMPLLGVSGEKTLPTGRDGDSSTGNAAATPPPTSSSKCTEKVSKNLVRQDDTSA